MAKAKGARKGNKVDKRDIFPEDPRETDRVIVLMGPTGSGKSTFVNKLLNDTVASVGNDLESHTAHIQPFIFPHRTGRIVVIDTPGFDTTYVDDQEILRRIADWLVQSHAAKMKLAGVIYFHRISDDRISQTATQNLSAFETFCGKKAANKVVLITTMWKDVSKEIGERNEAQMREKFWKEMLANGSRMFRLQDVDHTALEIVEFILGSNIPDARPLSTTREMVEDRKEFKHTEAALLISSQRRESLEERGGLSRFLSFIRALSEPQRNSFVPREEKYSSRKKSTTETNRKKLVQKSDSFMQDPATTDCVILILGLVRAGKSTFTNACIGEDLASVGHGTEPHTQHVRSFPIAAPTALHPRRIVVVDTPGFDHTDLSDRETLGRINGWLAQSYAANTRLAVIHLVNISESPSPRTKRYLDACHWICGQNPSMKVILATTMWSDPVPSCQVEHEQVLKEWWEKSYGPGSRMIQFENTPTSAADIVRFALDENDHSGIQIERELVDKDKPLDRTQAVRFSSRSGVSSSFGRRVFGR
ncbi:P-loop containing nucleoside triphosphate hydrolase protein [Lyophyllum atratum]|nr:P-loop containing nucleoside triphosphate hydrolase protein [Lyophyllum atratum]